MLNEVAKKHKYWLKVAHSFGAGQFAEDIVQEMYLKLHRYIEAKTIQEKTLTTYVYCIVRSLTLDLKRAQSKIKKVEVLDYYLTHESNSQSLEALETIYTKIDDEIKSWNWYDAKMFLTYVNSEFSQRDIASETGIKIGSVHYTIRKAGDKLKEAIGEDIQDYFNNDLELI